MRNPALSILFVVVCALTGVSAQTKSADEPFRLVAFSGTMVRVDVGGKRASAEQLRRATVLTASGGVRAVLVRTERVCEWLCGSEGDDEDGKECHFEAILRASANVKEAVAVLAGSPDVRAFAAMSAGSSEPIGSPERWIAAEPVEDGYSWTRFPDGVFLTFPKLGRDHYAPPIDLATCTVRPAAPFTLLSCDSAELLYEGSRGIAVSFADYGEDLITPLLRFRLGGRDAVVIELGVKAAVATALLIKGDDGRWRLNVRDDDYAHLC
jgi:hypothetical protein